MQSPMKAWVVCQIWAFLLLIPICADFTTAHNRYFLYWTTTHMWVYTCMLVALGQILFGIGWCLHCIRPQLFRRAAGILIAANILLLARLSIVAIVAVVLAGVFFYLRGWKLETMRICLARMALFMAFMVPLFIFTGFSYPTFPTGELTPLHRVPDRKPKGNLAPADNVYVFVFDEWSYCVSMTDGKPNELCPNLSKLANQMCIFTNAHAPGCHTLFSLPRFLFQRRDQYVLRNGQPGFWNDGRFYPSVKQSHVFAKMGRRGFRTYLVGWHHNYRAMFANQVDYIYHISTADSGVHSPFELSIDFANKWAGRILGSTLGTPLNCSENYRKNVAYIWQTKTLLHKVHRVLADPRKTGQFMVAHLPIPHGPFIFDKSGNVNSPAVEYDLTSLAHYKNHIGFLDKTIGEFVDSLKRQGKYDRSVIVFMSDHTWRHNPQMQRSGHNLSHVPLLVHFPNQKRYVRIDASFTTLFLWPLLDHVHANSGEFNELSRAIRQNDWYFPIPNEEVSMITLTSK